MAFIGASPESRAQSAHIGRALETLCADYRVNRERSNAAPALDRTKRSGSVLANPALALFGHPYSGVDRILSFIWGKFL